MNFLRPGPTRAGLVVTVMDKPSAGERQLADRLDHLFRTVHPKDRAPYTPAEVAKAINESAGERVISSTYIWQLRTGRRDNPTQRHLSALAAFFGVSPVYFFDQAEADRNHVPPELASALRDRTCGTWHRGRPACRNDH